MGCVWNERARISARHCNAFEPSVHGAVDGAGERYRNMSEINQADIPFRLNEDGAQTTRTKSPTIVQPPRNLGDHPTPYHRPVIY